MTDYVITAGRSSSYPTQHYGAHFTGSRATYCLDADFAALDANTLAIPNLPISVLSATPVTVTDSFFGMHVQKRINDPLVGVTASAVRSHDMENGKARWQKIETTAGVFDWADLDSWVNTHSTAGRDLIFTLFGTPSYYSARPSEQGIYGASNLGIQAEPSDMSKWDTFCTQVATRYLGKIKYYEVWNEPNMNNNGTTASSTSFFFSGTFAKLSEMTRRANQAIKAIDPTAKIICSPVQGWAASGGNSSGDYFTGMMAASDGAVGTMRDWVDIIGVHLYLPANNRIQDLAGCISRVNTAKTTAGVSAKPTWDTESAPIGPGNELYELTEEQGKALITRTLLTLAACGVERTFYYQYDHGTMGIKDRADMIRQWNQTADLLKSGTILTVSSFNDGRVAYYTASGLVII